MTTPKASHTLSPLQRRVARLIGCGFSQAETARRAGVGTRTIRLWQQTRPDFVRACQLAQEEIGEPSATDALRSLLGSTDEHIVLGAARALLQHHPSDAEPSERSAASVTFQVRQNPDGLGDDRLQEQVRDEHVQGLRQAS